MSDRITKGDKVFIDSKLERLLKRRTEGEVLNVKNNVAVLCNNMMVHVSMLTKID